MEQSLHLKNEWYRVEDVNTIDSPALVLYKERIKDNLRLIKDMVDNTGRLRPHVKTNKMAEVCAMMLKAGIQRFKCATIAEAEMLAMIQAPDVLLAYQPVGPKIMRLINLVKAYPTVQFACLADNIENVQQINEAAEAQHTIIPVFIDLNIGMNRTGVVPDKAMPLVKYIQSLSHVRLKGLHGYDGHIHDSDLTIRQQKSDEGFRQVEALYKQIEKEFGWSLEIVMGGTPTFSTHLRRPGVVCSPGTFIFSDWGYKNSIREQHFDFAALVIARVISVVDEQTVSIDLGYKAVAAENPLPRVHFLNAPDAVPTAQSEEHLVLKVPDASQYPIGTVLYGVPVHICPTVALYDNAYVIKNRKIVDQWEVIARRRRINF